MGAVTRATKWPVQLFLTLPTKVQLFSHFSTKCGMLKFSLPIFFYCKRSTKLTVPALRTFLRGVTPKHVSTNVPYGRRHLSTEEGQRTPHLTSSRAKDVSVLRKISNKTYYKGSKLAAKKVLFDYSYEPKSLLQKLQMCFLANIQPISMLFVLEAFRDRTFSFSLISHVQM